MPHRAAFHILTNAEQFFLDRMINPFNESLFDGRGQYYQRWFTYESSLIVQQSLDVGEFDYMYMYVSVV